jgi:hypothetical protein
MSFPPDIDNKPQEVVTSGPASDHDHLHKARLHKDEGVLPKIIQVADLGGDVDLTTSPYQKRDSQLVASVHGNIESVTDTAHRANLVWDTKTKHGIVREANGKMSFEFKPTPDGKSEELTARLNDHRYLHALNGENAYNEAVRNQLARLKANTDGSGTEHIYSNGLGDFSVFSKDGKLYQYDHKARSICLQSGNDKISFEDGKTFAIDPATGAKREVGADYLKEHGLAGLVTSDGFTVGDTKFDKATGTIRTQSDRGEVEITSSDGQSALRDARTGGTLTLKADGSITNTNRDTQGVLSYYNHSTNVIQGRTASGDTVTIDQNGVRVNEAADAQQADLSGNGSFGTSIASALGSLGDVSGSNMSRLWDQYFTLTDYAGQLTAKGMIGEAEKCIGQANEILKEIHSAEYATTQKASAEKSESERTVALSRESASSVKRFVPDGRISEEFWTGLV